MSVHPSFGKASPVVNPNFPIVLRFAGLHPADLGRFRMHDKRDGGDLAHVDQEISSLNEILHAEPNWQETLRKKVAQARHDNFHQQAEALRAKGRKKERTALLAEGMSDPWKRCTKSGGPLREGILTVNKAWFGGTGAAEWNPLKIQRFRKTAMDFLQSHFPDGQLLYASAHSDEEAWHVHFVVAVWTERITANRGRQILLQASVNPLLQNYECAQTLAGEAFAPLGLIRGERRAEAARLARATGQEPPPKRHHVPPSEWRAAQLAEGCEKAAGIVMEAKEKARNIIEDGRIVAKAAIRKSRKRAIREAAARKAEAARHVTVARRQQREIETMTAAKVEAATDHPHLSGPI